jgi:hypothetical protein
VLIAGLALGVVAFAVAGLVNSYAVFVAMFAVAGLGNTAYHPADYSLLSQHTPPSRIGQVFSFHTFSGILGSAVAPATLLAVQSQFGWRGAFVAAAILGAAVLALLILQWPSEPEATAEKHPPKASGKADETLDQQTSWSLLLSPPIMLNLGFFILISIMGGITNILIVALAALYGTPDTVANISLTALLSMRACWWLSGFANDPACDGRRTILGFGRRRHAVDGPCRPFDRGADRRELPGRLVHRHRQPFARHAGARSNPARRVRTRIRLRLLGLQHRLDVRADDLRHDDGPRRAAHGVSDLRRLQHPVHRHGRVRKFRTARREVSV